jgi:hypothetical protein
MDPLLRQISDPRASGEDTRGTEAATAFKFILYCERHERWRYEHPAAIDESSEEKEKTFSYCAMGWLERWFRFKGVIDNVGGEVEETEGDHRTRNRESCAGNTDRRSLLSCNCVIWGKKIDVYCIHRASMHTCDIYSCHMSSLTDPIARTCLPLMRTAPASRLSSVVCGLHASNAC